MKYFSIEEFDKMYHEIMVDDEPCFDTMLYIAKNVLYNMIRKWCYEDSALRGRQYEDDIMQEINIRLVKNCVNGFFKKKSDGNYDPKGFNSWIKTVATNVFIDFAKKVKNDLLNKTEEIDGNIGGIPPGTGKIDSSDFTVKRLNNAFKIVIESDSKVHIVLTWLTQMIIIASTYMNKIDSNNIIENKFSSMTLDEMLLFIIKAGKHIPWLHLEQNQIEKIKLKLNATDKYGSRLGDIRYEAFYMKKGPKASISDWVNRMNSQIEKKFKNF